MWWLWLARLLSKQYSGRDMSQTECSIFLSSLWWTDLVWDPLFQRVGWWPSPPSHWVPRTPLSPVASSVDAWEICWLTAKGLAFLKLPLRPRLPPTPLPARALLWGVQMGTPALECSVLATATVNLGGRGTPAGVRVVSLWRGYSVWTPASPTPVNVEGGAMCPHPRPSSSVSATEEHRDRLCGHGTFHNPEHHNSTFWLSNSIYGGIKLHYNSCNGMEMLCECL